jgi:hypothetical protein
MQEQQTQFKEKMTKHLSTFPKKIYEQQINTSEDAQYLYSLERSK